ncbi:MAG: hypothetical protein IID34_14185 [Planctomycetes bacterium]|nr:hypothetical protein [Planctomycetota bacterium]
MPVLNPQQTEQAVSVMSKYLNAPATDHGKTPVELGTALDRDRVDLIEEQLKPLLTGYLQGQVGLSEFKTKTDGINKRHEYWGFKGIKGQMFFNMTVNVADDEGECDQELKSALAVPVNDDIARSRIKTFSSYVKRIGDQHVEAGESKQSTPKVGSIPFFLSYFWHIQDREVWPVYYTNTVNTMADLNLWEPTDDPAQNYITFKHIHSELAEAFSKASGDTFGFYEVEHVFWFKGANPYTVAKKGGRNGGDDPPVINKKDKFTGLLKLPESFVPPVVAVLPTMASHDAELVDAAKASGTNLETAFEKHVNAAFKVLGYEAKLLGQGHGRVPDGLAVALDDAYAILWDAKVRGNGYSMGTDDRTIREYIDSQKASLKRFHLRNTYYCIVSSSFTSDSDEAIRSLKMETDISEVCLLNADALVVMVEIRLRDPLGISLGTAGLQRVFSVSGVVSAETVRNALG